MEIVSSYIPIDRRFALTYGVALPEKTQGAVLFADISGFTSLTETLAQELGPQRGAEEITHQLNNVFGALTAVVHRFGGSIINFSGDAITCWFDEEMKGEKTAVSPAHRATDCAITMQASMLNFANIITLAQSTINLRIKIAVTAGSAHRFLVGAAHVQTIEVLAGSLLDRMAIAEKEINPGEIIVGSEVVQTIGDSLVIQEWRTTGNSERFAIVTDLKQPTAPAFWGDAPIVPVETAQNWLLQPVFQQIQQGEEGFLAELRPAVSLFLKFSGLHYDHDPRAGRKLDDFIRWTQTVLARYEGHLLQLTMGDKGSYLYAVFGAPIAHEDDPARAVAAAFTLRQLPAELQFIQDLQIGISRGQMHAGAYGGLQRRTYGVLGKEVNVAARLMNQAQIGQILVTEQVAQAAAATFTFTEMGEFSLKGMERPLPLYTVTGKQDEKTADTLKGRHLMPMVGRETHLNILTEQLQALRLGDPCRCAIIEAEAGMGKSRLIVDLLDMAEAISIKTLIGASDAVERTTAYHTWRAIFSQLCQLHTTLNDNSPKQVWQAYIQDWLQQAAPDSLSLAPLLNAILPVDFSENEWTSQMTGEVRATNTQALCVHLLSQATYTEPLLLVLEDAYWMDSASWALARLVYRDVPSLLLVLATRPMLEELPPEYTFIRNGRHTQFLPLENLPAPAIEALVRNRLGATALPEQVTSLIHQKAGGHPFFSEELACSLYDHGLLEITDGVGQLATGVTNLQAMDFPDTIQGVITSRIDRLEPRQQLVLKVASVIGRIFAYHVLRDVHPARQESKELLAHLHLLEQSDLTLQEMPEPNLAYIFKHVITQEVSYSLLLFAQRRQLHRAVAEWYEAQHQDDLAVYYPLLAHHWQNAIDTPQAEDTATEKALSYLDEAGRQALRNYANKEAIRFFSEALTLNEQAGQPRGAFQQALWHEGIANAQFFLGHIVDSEKAFHQAITLLGYPIPANKGQIGLRIAKEAGMQIRHRLRRVTAVQDPRQQEILRHTANCYMQLASLHYLLNQPTLLLYDSLLALNLLERLPPTGELARSYSIMIILTGVIPHHGWAAAYQRRTKHVLATLNDPQAEATADLRIAIYHIGIASWKDQTALEQVCDFYRQIKDMRNLGDSLMPLAHTHYYQGQFRQAQEICGELHEVARDYENRQHEAWGIAYQARSLMLMGEAATAVPMIEQAIELQGEQIGEADEIIYTGMLSLGYLRLQQTDKALAQARKGIMLLQKTQPSIFATREAYIGPALVYLSLWEAADHGQTQSLSLPELQKAAKQACKLLRSFARVFPIGKPYALLYQGWFYWLTGKGKKALKQWELAQQTAESLHMPYEIGLARYEIGRHLPLNDPAHHQHLQQACQQFEKLEALYDLTQTKSLLAT